MIGIAKRLALQALTGEAVLARARAHLPAVHAVVLMYHEVAGDDVDIESWTVVRSGDLQRQLDYIARNYDIVSIGDALARLASPTGRPAAVVTFDDGHKGNLETLLPIVDSRRIPVTIFVASGHVESQKAFWFDRLINALQTADPIELDLRRFGTLGKYVVNESRGAPNWVQFQRLLQDLKTLDPERCELVADEIVAELAQHPSRPGGRLRPMTPGDIAALAASPYVEIGGHSHCHRLQTQLSEQERRESIERNRRLLTEWTGRTIEHFAYPSGANDPHVVATVRASGYRTAMTTAPGLWLAGSDPFLIPRLGVGRYDGAATFRAGLFGGARMLAALLTGARTAVAS